MKPSTRLYAWLKLLTALHIVEQLIFGMQDLHDLQHMLAIYETWFRSSCTAIAILTTITGALAVLAVRCIVEGGFARFVTMFALGLPTIGEVHHLVATTRAGHYMPGTVTAVPSIVCGVLFLRALIKEYRPSKTVRVTAAIPLQVAA